MQDNWKTGLKQECTCLINITDAAAAVLLVGIPAMGYAVDGMWMLSLGKCKPLRH